MDVFLWILAGTLVLFAAIFLAIRFIPISSRIVTVSLGCACFVVGIGGGIMIAYNAAFKGIVATARRGRLSFIDHPWLAYAALAISMVGCIWVTYYGLKVLGQEFRPRVNPERE